ncbi:MAG TPA: efflux RND transporter periplasmic adaptor subunit [Terriglobales bacterium]|nr:efflux RND transporter periplasmic adaptor subunit [Terriglobales bacterium]
MPKGLEQRGFAAKRRWILWGAGIALAVVLLASFASRDDTVPVLAARVTRSTIRSVISTNGKVEPVHNFEAHAPTGTTVKRVHVREGDHVRKGQLLAELDAANARSQAAQALAQVRAAEADVSALERGGTQEEVLTLTAELVKARGEYEAALRNLDALKRLQQSGAASPGEVRAAQNQLDAAAAQVKLIEAKQKQRYSRPEVARVEAQHAEARSAYQAAQDTLSQLVIRAPFDGTVYSLPVKEGAYVNPGDLVLQEADLSRVVVRAFVDEPDVARLAPGEKIEVTWDAMPGRIWTGSVTAIPAVVKLRGTRNVGETTCIVGNQDYRLLPNINVGVTIVTAEHANALTIPREALRQDDSVPYVYQIVENVLRRQNVQTAISNLTKVEVVSGIPENAQVAVASVNSKPLHDRSPVRVIH